MARTKSFSSFAPVTALRVGRGWDRTSPGTTIDEISFSSETRDANWVKASYDNQKPGSSYLGLHEFPRPPRPIRRQRVLRQGGHGHDSHEDFRDRRRRPFLLRGRLASGSIHGRRHRDHLGHPVDHGRHHGHHNHYRFQQRGRDAHRHRTNHRQGIRPHDLPVQDGLDLVGIRWIRHPDRLSRIARLAHRSNHDRRSPRQLHHQFIPFPHGSRPPLLSPPTDVNLPMK